MFNFPGSYDIRVEEEERERPGPVPSVPGWIQFNSVIVYFHGGGKSMHQLPWGCVTG